MDGDGESVKLGLVTVNATVVLAVRLPEVPLIVTGDVPTVAELLAVSVSTLDPVVGFVPKDAVTPLGRPDATRVTLPLNPFAPVTVMVSVALLSWATDKLDAEGESVKLGGLLTVNATVVLVVRPPEVPLIVTVDVPTVAELLAVSVSTLDPVVGFVPKDAVTPLGRPNSARVTLPLNPPTRATVMVSVALLPWTTDRLDAEGESVKPVSVTAND